MDSPVRVFLGAKKGLPIYPGPTSVIFDRDLFPKNHARIQVVFLKHSFFLGWKKFAQRIFFQTRLFLLLRLAVWMVSTLLTRWLASFRHMELTHNENDICMPVPRVQRATGFFLFFLRKFVKKKHLGGVMLCDVWGVQTSEIFNNSTFSTQDRSCCQSLWFESRYSICTWDIFK